MKTETQVALIDAPELSAVEPSKAAAIRNAFIPMSEMVYEFEDQFNEIITASKEGIDKQLTAKAKRLRLDISKARIETEKTRKVQKEEYLRAGKAIDAVANILKWAVEDKERQLQDIEKHFENLEKKRLEKLQAERVEMLSPYVDDAEMRDLSSMEDDVWDIYFAGKKQEYEDRIAAEKAAQKAREAEQKKQEVYRERKDTILPMLIYRKGEDIPEGMELTVDTSEAQFKKIKAWYKDGESAYIQRQEESERIAKQAQEKADRIEKRSTEMAPYMSVIDNFSEMLDMEEEEYVAQLEVAKNRLRQFPRTPEESFKEEPITIPVTGVLGTVGIEFLSTDSEKMEALKNDLLTLKTKYTFDDPAYAKKGRGVAKLIDKIVNDYILK